MLLIKFSNKKRPASRFQINRLSTAYHLFNARRSRASRFALHEVGKGCFIERHPVAAVFCEVIVCAVKRPITLGNHAKGCFIERHPVVAIFLPQRYKTFLIKKYFCNFFFNFLPPCLPYGLTVIMFSNRVVYRGDIFPRFISWMPELAAAI